MERVFIARQPIVTGSGELFAHELLFRDFADSLNLSDGVHFSDLYTTSRVAVNAMNQFGINRLVGDRHAFINVDGEFIYSDFIKMLPKDRFIMEILEDVKIDEQLAARVEELVREGYRFALDDAVFDDEFIEKYEPVLSLVKIVKIDIRLNEIENVKRMIGRLERYGTILFLAEKVESIDEYREYRDAGCTLFQGYFFAKPEVSEKRSLDPAEKSILEITGLLAEDSSSLDAIARAFEGAPDLSLQLLQFLNSASFAFKNPIRSIVHAVNMIGRSELLTWLYLLAYAKGDASKMRSSPLVSLAAFRSKLMRKISALHRDGTQMQDMAALTGTLSLADILFQIPIADIMKEIEIDESIKAALLGKSGVLAEYLNISEAVERADLKRCVQIAERIGIDIGELELSVLESY